MPPGSWPMAILIVALDLPTETEALALVDALGPSITHYKVGAQLFTSAGPQVIRELGARGKRTFLDLKYHDIPQTVARATEAAANLGVDMLTLHASGGAAMMRAARDAVGPKGPRLIAVTLLTSMTATDIESIWAKELRSLREEVARLAGITADAGLDGVVASPLEAEALKRRYGAKFLVVTPGIRLTSNTMGDQARTASPAEAVRVGADFLVVGRPILEAPDPSATAAQLLEQVAAPELAE